jgi:hypothetical protein
MSNYILDATGNQPVHEPDYDKFYEWRRNNANQMIVKKEKVGDVEVSTVFLGIDHGWFDKDHPILWETMTFGDKIEQIQARCEGNREQAEAMHQSVVNDVKTQLSIA